MTRARVVLADDHRMLREAFARLLEPRYTIVGEAADGRELVSVAEQLRPDVVVLDIAMPLLDGLDAARILKQHQPEIKLVFLTVSEDPDVAAEAFRLGASAFLLKNSAASELLQAVDAALQGRSYVTPLAASDVVDAVIHHRELPRSKHHASPRQREVLRLLAEGRTMKQIAGILEITPRTVAFHKYTLMSELGIKSTAELVQFAVRQGIVPG